MVNLGLMVKKKPCHWIKGNSGKPLTMFNVKVLNNVF